MGIGKGFGRWVALTRSDAKRVDVEVCIVVSLIVCKLGSSISGRY